MPLIISQLIVLNIYATIILLRYTKVKGIDEKIFKNIRRIFINNEYIQLFRQYS